MNEINKKINKRVKFDFYQEDIKINGTNKDIFEEVFDYYIGQNGIKTNIKINQEEIEIEPNSLFKENNLYFFIISNLRNDILPAKKRIGEEKVDIRLEEDEYIGEFTGIVYDKSIGVFMIQVNKYGVNVKNIEEYLKKLINIYLVQKNNEEIEKFSLNMVLNPDEIESVADSKEIRRIVLKSSTSSLAQLKKRATKAEENNIRKISEIVNTFGNVNFEISISANFKAKETLEKETAKSFIESIKEMLGNRKKGEIAFSVTRKKDDNSNVDTVDFLLPKMVKYINLKVEPKKSIGRDYLRVEMFKGYSEISDKIRRVIYG